MKTIPIGIVTDKTPERLFQAGWRLEGNNPWIGLWNDPRTGKWYAISQAEGIRVDRIAPTYAFKR